ncbi:hypothetical protein K490DRAFT_13, partial [Saccharata proteae CBS 121410]
LREAQARLEVLLQQQKLAEIRKRIEELENPGTHAPRTRRARSSDASSGDEDRQRKSKSRRHIKPRDPEKFNGKNMKQYRDYISDCETAFDTCRDFFMNEERTFLNWSAMFLEGDPKIAWRKHEKRMRSAGEPIDWNMYKKFLIDLLVDPVNRGLNAATKHDEAKQRPGQTVRQFVTYLETLEEELAPTSEESQVQTLYAKLRKELKTAITNHMTVPATREELVVVATTMETNL